jgi:hypothetical protein
MTLPLRSWTLLSPCTLLSGPVSWKVCMRCVWGTNLRSETVVSSGRFRSLSSMMECGWMPAFGWTWW